MNEQVLSVWRSLMEHGTRCLGKESYVEAERYFLQSASLAEELHVPEIRAFNLRLLGTVRVRLGKLDLAESGFHEALEICEQVQNYKGMSEAKAGLASVAVLRGALEEAKDWYESSIAVYPTSSPPLRLGMLYFDLGQVYAAVENWNKAYEAYDQARDLCHQNQYPKGEGELNVLLGEVCYRRGEMKLAQSFLREACCLFFNINENEALANAFQYLAFLHYDMGEMEQARGCQQRAVVFWLRLGIEEDISESCHFLSKIEQSLGYQEESEYHLDVSIKLYKKEDVGLALRFQSLAGLAVVKMDFTQAEAIFLEALRIFESFGDDLKSGEIFEALAYLAEMQGKEYEALEYRRQALAKQEEASSPNLAAILRLGEFYEKRRNYYDALNFYWQALKLAHEDGAEEEKIEQMIQRVSRRIRKKKTNWY